MLAGYPDAYEKINNEWSQINSLHKKIVKFIGTNLSKKYGITVNDTLPVHLLGKMAILYDDELNLPLKFAKQMPFYNHYTLRSLNSYNLIRKVAYKDTTGPIFHQIQCPTQI